MSIERTPADIAQFNSDMERIHDRMVDEHAMIAYQLPDGSIVRVLYSTCRAASVITYTLKGGEVVDAIIVRGER